MKESKNKEEKQDTKLKLWLCGLAVMVVCLSVGLVFLLVAYENLDDKYDDLAEDAYKYGGRYSTDLDDDFVNDPGTGTGEDNPSTTPNSRITQQQALQVALKNLNVTQDKIYDLDYDLEYKARYSTLVYEVSFDYGNYEYEYYIDAYTGKILDSFKERDF